MARKALIRSNFYPYHVVNRTLDKKFYSLNAKDLWNLYVEVLFVLVVRYGVKIHAFVLMSNHYHLLISTPEENLDAAIRYLQTEVSKRVKSIVASSAYRFETRYKWSIIRNCGHYMQVLRYIYQNPVRARIVEKSSDYPWSTLHGQMGHSPLKIPLSSHELEAEYSTIFEDLLEFENWINFVYSERELNRIRSGLRRFEFKPSSAK